MRLYQLSLLLSALLLFTATVSAQDATQSGTRQTGDNGCRREIELRSGWLFSRDKLSWQNVTVPHDWAISGPFDKKWDLQTVAIEQNGETRPTEKSGRSGALPWIGEGYYKRTLTIPQDFDGHAELVFDGAMAEPTVSVNGRFAGYWAYGYNTFRIDITKFVKPGDNLLEVSLANKEESSRWYPGAGIYRPVKLVLTPKVYIDDWSLFVRTTTIAKGRAELEVDMQTVPDTWRTDIEGLKPVNHNFTFTLLDADNREVASSGPVGNSGNAHAKLTVKNPMLWSPETPYLYKLVAKYTEGGVTIDQKTVNVGIRTFRVSKEHGFQLNGVTRKLKGVCLHHDLGPLGAAVNKAALIRQIKILKDMGCDAIRTAHNMPSQMQMDVCDSLGMMVMAESFDMWIYPKCKNGYARFFHDWADKDITNLIKAHRNHPSIVMWSIGNEIPEQGSEDGRQIAVRLQGLCHSLDPTRPVTQGMDRAEQALRSGMAQTMDVPGFNYRVHKYQKNIEQLPQGFLLGSETASTVSSRGFYRFPVEPNGKEKVFKDGQCSSYDVEWCSWSNLPDDDWVWQDNCPWVIGEFVWTGFDYLGEPTPYDEYWPSRSSYFGICDLAGLPKDRYYLYRSHWRNDDHTIHLLPHWTWTDRKGQVTPVYCYTDYPEAELFVNGKSQGRIRKSKTINNEVLKVAGIEGFKDSARLDRYRLRWNDVKYESGELRVVVYDEQGNAAGEETMKTAGKPARLQLDTWTQQSKHSPLPLVGQPQVGNGVLSADGDDLAFVTVSLVDKQGTLIPYAQDQLRFEVEGAGTFRAVCNGDTKSLEPFTQPAMRLFNGQLVVVLQAATHSGTLRLKVYDTQRHLTAQTSIEVK